MGATAKEEPTLRTRLRTLLVMLALGTPLAWWWPAPSVQGDWLVAQAVAAGWVQTDPVVRQRLVDNLRFAGVEGDDEALFALALSLGMERTDPVVRRRFESRLRAVLDASLPAPSEEQLRTFYAENQERYAPPSVWVLAQHGQELRGTTPRLERRLELSLTDAEPGDVLGEVRVLAKETPPLPPLASVRARVEADWRAQALPAHRQARLAALGAP